MRGTGNTCHAAQAVVEGARIGARDDTPTSTVPVHNQGFTSRATIRAICSARAAAVGHTRLTDRPDVVGCDDGYSIQGVAVRLNSWTGNDLPACAIPLFGQRLSDVAVVIIADRPHSAAPWNTTHAGQVVVGCWISAGNNIPL